MKPVVSDEEADEIECMYCGVTDAVRFEWRNEFAVSPMGTFSLSGSNIKFSATMLQWPWAVCLSSLDGCGHESKGKPA